MAILRVLHPSVHKLPTFLGILEDHRLHFPCSKVALARAELLLQEDGLKRRGPKGLASTGWGVKTWSTVHWK